jgi:hypothetical protein
MQGGGLDYVGIESQGGTQGELGRGLKPSAGAQPRPAGLRVKVRQNCPQFNPVIRL